MNARMTLTVAALALASACLPGCVQRKLRITSEPPGARVWVNDVEIGTTPAETAFTFYGWYDIRLERPGFEPVMTEREAVAPIWEWPGVDLVAEVLPIPFDHTAEFHFDLTPAPETYLAPDELEEDLLRRARATRARLGSSAR